MTALGVAIAAGSLAAIGIGVIVFFKASTRHIWLVCARVSIGRVFLNPLCTVILLAVVPKNSRVY
jgi:hypothetical protein